EADITVVPNGVDVRRFGPGPKMDLGTSPGSVVIGFVGSMKPWHGVEDLVVAAGPVLARHPNAALVLAGDGPQAGAIRDLVATLGLDGRVLLLGAVEHGRIPSLLRAIDVAAAPYRPSDDFYFSPLKVLEYMASGCVTVYAEIGDLPDLVSGGGIGYRAGDVRGLQDALERLVSDASTRAALGRRARQRALDLTWDGVVSSIEQIVGQPAAESA